MEINLPEVKAEVEAAFARYETALMANDVGHAADPVLEQSAHDPLWNGRNPVRLGGNRRVSLGTLPGRSWRG